MIRRLTSLIFLISIISTFPLILTSCGGIPIHAQPEKDLPSGEDVQELIGHRKNDVSDQLGEPDYYFKGPESEYFVYEGYGVVDIMWDIFLPFMILPGEVYGVHEVFYCVLIEFDQDSRVIRYDSDWKYHPFPSTCAPLLFNSEMRTKIICYLREQASAGDSNAVFVLAKLFEARVSEYRDILIRNVQAGDADSAYTLADVFNERKHLQSLATTNPLAIDKLNELLFSKYGYDINTLLVRARQGDKDVQWQLYTWRPMKESLAWLCRAADQGHAHARNELGKLYFYGSDQYRYMGNVHIPADISRACMWFDLSGLVQITKSADAKDYEYTPGLYISNQVERTANALTEEDLAKAEKLILAWKPGQCDRDISRYPNAGNSELTALCMAADQGDFSARDKLGWIYYWGSHGIESDRRRAYMWFYLAASVYIPSDIESMQVHCDSMTRQQRIYTLKLLEEWKPGKCEQDLLHK